MQSLVRYFRFSVVGALATGVHSLAYLLGVAWLGLEEQTANLLAFLLALPVSFSGHAGWTFRSTYELSSKSRRLVFFQFSLTAILGYCLNAFFVFLVEEVFRLPFFLAVLPFVFCTPVIIYLLSSLWVFR